jgi:DNA-binding MarR family transcriptional regulator
MNGDFLGSLGHVALGSRLKRTGTRLQAATQAWLRDTECDVPAAHMPLLAALDSTGPASLGTLADLLGIAQPGVSRMVESLEAAGWIKSTPQSSDKRIRLLELTAAGRELVDDAKKNLWPMVQAAVIELCADLSGPLTDQLDALEAKLSAGAYEDALRSNAQHGRRKRVTA